VPGVAGTWKDLTDNVNLLAANLTTQVRNIAEVTTAVARGDLSRKITVDVKGEILELKNTINTMVDQLNGFASEVTRVAREVGTEGKLGGQAEVPGVAGTWKDLTDTVNVMAANLTEQVRGIVKVVTAVANGDLKQNLTVKSKGEVAALAETINNMTDTLAIFADQVTTVAREVGVEGPPRRPGQRAGRRRHLEGPHRQRQPAGNEPDHPGPRHRRSGDRRDQGRPDALHSGPKRARGRRAQRQHHTMIDNLRAHHGPQHRAGLAEKPPRQVHQHAPGPARPRHRRPAAATELTPLVNAQLGVIYQVESEETQDHAPAVGPMPTTAPTAIRCGCGSAKG
jgi:HAMP domain-containing protein